jgi:hypothetical protein
MAKTQDTAVTRTFAFEKATKNTYRFQEEPGAGEPPIIGTLYVQKFIFNGTTPGHITVTLSTEG